MWRIRRWIQIFIDTSLIILNSSNQKMSILGGSSQWMVQWLITPKDRVVGPLPNGLFMASTWGFTNYLLPPSSLLFWLDLTPYSPNILLVPQMEESSHGYAVWMWLTMSREGCGRAKAKAKGIKTSEEGNHLLSCMRDYLEEVMERLKKVTQMDISENTVMGSAAEVAIAAGLNDRGRSLLIFRFKDSHLATYIFPMIRTLPSTIGCYCALPQRQIMIWKYWIWMPIGIPSLDDGVPSQTVSLTISMHLTPSPRMIWRDCVPM